MAQAEPGAETSAFAAAIPRNLATRTRPSFLARAAAWLGIAPMGQRAATAAILGASYGAGAAPIFGAPLGAPAGVPALDPVIAAMTDAVRDAMGFFSTRSEAVFGVLEAASPRELAEVDRAFGLGYGRGPLSLREALNAGLTGTELRRGLDLIEAKATQLRRPGGEPAHDLHADPSGFFGPAIDGRLPQTIDKVLELRRLRKLSRADLVMRHELTPNNRVQVLAGCEPAFREMLQAIDDAQDFVHLSFFIFKDDEHGRALADKLIEKAKQGVRVRVTLDELGDMLAGSFSSSRLMQRLRAGGVEVARNCVFDLSRTTEVSGPADHRKVVIVDGKVAFTGGMNVGTNYIREWRDHMMRLEGDAVHQLNVEWITNWLGLGKELDAGASDAEVRARYFPVHEVRGGPRVKVAQTIPGHNEEIFRAYLQMIEHAERSIWIESPYITSPEIQQALLRAVKERGIALHVIIPGQNNHPTCDLAARESFRAMLEAGATIVEYPGMCHGKVMVVDERYTIFGTANLDDLSLINVGEVNVHIDDPGTAQAVLRDILLPDSSKATPVTTDDIGPVTRAASRFWQRLFGRYL